MADALMESGSNSLQKLCDSNVIGIALGRADGALLEANDAFLAMVGYDRADVYAGRMRWTDMTPPEWDEVNHRLNEQLQRTGSAGPIEKEYLRKDGSRAPVLFGLARLEGTAETAILALDLTERKRVEADLRASEERFRTAFEIVKQTGGAISVYSEPGVNSTFKIYLPQAETRIEPAAASYSKPLARALDEMILLVEDDDGIRQLTAEILREQGYQVMEATDGEGALEAAAVAGRIDLLLTDVVMKRMHGAELARRLQTARPEIKVLFMSGYTEKGIVQHGVLDPDVSFLGKPFNPEELLRKVDEVLAPSRPLELLLVDDDAQVRSMVSGMLEDEGYVVRQAASRQEALEATRDECPDVVITDIVMPDGEGLETIRGLRQIRGSLRIVVMSGAMSGAYLSAARKLGADAVILKPFDAETLVSEIRRLTRGVSSAAETEGSRSEQLSDRTL